MKNYTLPADNYSGVDDWRADGVNCTIYMTLYVVSIKYIPTILIAVLNLAIAWKLKVIWKRRRHLRNRIGNTTKAYNSPSISFLANSTTRYVYSLPMHKLS